MKIVIDVPEHFMNRIQNLYAKKNYTDMGAFLTAALENQLQMEESLPAQAITAFDQAATGSKISIAANVIAERKLNMERFKCRDLYKEIKLLPDLSDEKLYQSKDVVGSTGQLWGQINRIFPVKVTLRLLAAALVDSNNKLSIEEFRILAADYARQLGIFLAGRMRDEQKCSCVIGLPVGEEGEKSKMRFMNHFVLSQRTDGLLDGALAKLKFVNVDKQEIGLTKCGYAFMMLSNPILDGENGKNQCKPCVSPEEAEFYISHIKKQVRDEFDAMLWLLTTINRKCDTRKEMERELKFKYKDWSYAVVTTQHMGLVSRCCELGLINKLKSGKEVKYILTAFGKKITSTSKNEPLMEKK